MNSVQISTDRDLARKWQNFADVIRLFAEKRSSRNEITQEKYRSIHDALLQAVGKEDAALPEQCDVLHEIKQLAEPWVNVESLKQADTALMKDLAKRCDDLSKQLANRRSVKLSAGVSLAILVGVFVGAFVLVMGMDVWTGLYDGLFDGSRGIIGEWVDAVERNRDNSRSWLIAVVVAMAISVIALLVFRAPRTY